MSSDLLCMRRGEFRYDQYTVLLQTAYMQSAGAAKPNVKTGCTQALHLSEGIVTADDKHYVHPLNSLDQNNSRVAKIGVRIKIQKNMWKMPMHDTPGCSEMLNMFLKSYLPKKWSSSADEEE